MVGGQSGMMEDKDWAGRHNSRLEQPLIIHSTCDPIVTLEPS